MQLGNQDKTNSEINLTNAKAELYTAAASWVKFQNVIGVLIVALLFLLMAAVAMFLFGCGVFTYALWMSFQESLGALSP